MTHLDQDRWSHDVIYKISHNTEKINYIASLVSYTCKAGVQNFTERSFRVDPQYIFTSEKIQLSNYENRNATTLFFFSKPLKFEARSHFLLQGIFLTQGSKPGSPALASEFLTTEPSGKQNILSYFREKWGLKERKNHPKTIVGSQA